MTIFRENALKAAQGRGLIHPTLTVITPSVMIGMLASLLMLLVLVIWGWFANIPITTEGAGIIVSQSDWQQALKNNEDTLAAKKAALNQAENLLNKKRELYLKHYLTEGDMVQAERDYLDAKNAYATPSTTDYIGMGNPFTANHETNAPTEALVILSNDDIKRIQRGMSASLYPRNLSQPSGHGMKATVVSITQYPISKELAEAYLGNRNMVDHFFDQGVPYFAVLKTEQSLKPGMLVSAKVITHTCHPIQLLMQADC
jgi:hypothetical protein